MKLSGALIAGIVCLHAARAPGQDCPEPPLLVTVGAGTSAGGDVPALNALQAPQDTSVELVIRSGPANHTGSLLFNTGYDPEFVPEYGGEVYPAAPQYRIPFTLDENGFAIIELDLSVFGSLPCGLPVTAQAVVRDTGSATGVSLSNGVMLAVGTLPAFGLEITAPVNGAIVNDATPAILAQVQNGGAAPGSWVVLLDGQDVTTNLIGFAGGLFGDAAFLGDGVHLLEMGAQGADGEPFVTDAAWFTVSTGGGPTVFTGLLLDPEKDAPIVGAEVWFEGDPANIAVTDASGRYTISDAPVGGQQLLVFDPREVDMPGFSYPLYKRPVEVSPGATTETDPCYLPKVFDVATFAELAGAGVFDCGTGLFLEDFVLQNTDEPLVTGVKLTIPAGTYVELLDGVPPCEGALSIAPVDKTKAPSNLPPGADPSLLITVQPTGMRFLDAPGGAAVALPITFPNKLNEHGEYEYASGNELQLFSVDHDTGTFQLKGTMLVDGAEIVTIAGGLEGGSWHCTCPPAPSTDGPWDEGGPSCPVNPDVDMLTGFIRESFALPRRVLFDEPFGFDLVYASRRVGDSHIERYAIDILATSTVPKLVSVEGSINGIPTGERFFTTEGLSEDVTTHLSLPLLLDTTGLPQGAYDIEVGVTSTFGYCGPVSCAGDGCGQGSDATADPGGFQVPLSLCPLGSPFNLTSAASAFLERRVRVARPDVEPFGRGWALSGDDRIVEGPAPDSLTLFEGRGGVVAFGNAVLSSERGLTVRFFDDALDTSVQSFYANGQPQAFTVHRAGLPPAVVEQATAPAVDFYAVGGPYLLSVGEDGIQQTLDPSDPLGDDVVFEANGGSDTFGVLLEGFFEVPEPGAYVFSALADDAFALEVDGSYVMDKTGDEAVSLTVSGSVLLEAGVVPVRVSLADQGGVALLSLLASGPGLPGGPLDEQVLFTGGSDDPSVSDAFLEEQGGTRITRLATGGYVREFPDKRRDTFDSDGRIVLSTDRRGRAVVFERDLDGRLAGWTDPVGGGTLLGYDGNRVTEILELATGRVTTLSYGGTDGDQLVSIMDATGEEWLYGYDGRDLLTMTQAPGLGANLHEYDDQGFGRYVGITYSDGATEGFVVRDLLGLVANDSILEAQAVTLAEHALASHTDGEGYTHFVSIDEQEGQLVMTDPLGRERRIAFLDDTGLVASVTEPDGTSVAYEWDEERRLPSAVVLTGDPGDADDDRRGELGWHETYAWVESVTVEPGTPLETTIDLELDPETGDVLAATDPLRSTVEMSYGPFGALDGLTVPSGLSLALTRDPVTLSTIARTVGPATTVYGRDAAGYVNAITLPDGSTTSEYGLDPLGRILWIMDPTGGLTSYQYTPTGRLAGVVDAKRPAAEESMTYDTRGRLVRYEDPLGVEETYAYDARNLLVSHTDRNGTSTSLVWDAAQRLTSRMVGRKLTTFGYDEADRPVDIDDGASHLIFEYSPFGDLLGESEVGLTPNSAIDRSFDARGQLASTSLSLDGVPVRSESLGYDAAGRLTTQVVDILDASVGSRSLEYGFAWDLDSRRASTTRPGLAVTEYGYDAQSGELTGVTMSIGGVVTAQDAMAYDVNGDLASRIELRSLMAGLEATYSHDGLHRLENVTEAGEVTPFLDATPYDGASNRNADVWSYDVADQLLGTPVATYEYDANGARTRWSESAPRGAIRDYHRDAEGRLVEVRDGEGVLVSDYAYDALGRLVGANGLRFVPDGGTGAWLAIIDGADRVYPIDDAVTGDRLSLVSDLGVVQLFTNDRGDVVQAARDSAVVGEWRLGPFGATLAASGELPGAPERFAFGLSGRYADEAADLHAMGARFLDPSIGAFISRDPEWFSLALRESPAASSRYGYAAMSPHRFQDRDGRKWSCIAKNALRNLAACGVSAGVGAALGAAAAAGVASGYSAWAAGTSIDGAMATHSVVSSATGDLIATTVVAGTGVALTAATGAAALSAGVATIPAVGAVLAVCGVVSIATTAIQSASCPGDSPEKPTPSLLDQLRDLPCQFMTALGGSGFNIAPECRPCF